MAESDEIIMGVALLGGLVMFSKWKGDSFSEKTDSQNKDTFVEKITNTTDDQLETGSGTVSSGSSPGETHDVINIHIDSGSGKEVIDVRPTGTGFFRGETEDFSLIEKWYISKGAWDINPQTGQMTYGFDAKRRRLRREELLTPEIVGQTQNLKNRSVELAQDGIVPINTIQLESLGLGTGLTDDELYKILADNDIVDKKKIDNLRRYSTEGQKGTKNRNHVREDKNNDRLKNLRTLARSLLKDPNYLKASDFSTDGKTINLDKVAGRNITQVNLARRPGTLRRSSYTEGTKGRMFGFNFIPNDPQVRLNALYADRSIRRSSYVQNAINRATGG